MIVLLARAGATSADITDNADLIVMREACELLIRKVARCIQRLAIFAETYRSVPCLGSVPFTFTVHCTVHE